MVVPAGATSATFPIATDSVSAITSVNVIANYNATQSAVLTINPPVLASITLNPNSVTGGTALVGTATLTGAALPELTGVRSGPK